MAKCYYSTIFERPADEVWSIIRDFNNYSVWVDVTDHQSLLPLVQAPGTSCRILTPPSPSHAA
jgi:hypothetical protein